MLALPVGQILLLVDKAERHRGENESDVQPHDRIIHSLNGFGISSVVEMLLQRTRGVLYALRRGGRFGEISACRLLIRERLSERHAVRVYTRLRRLGDLGAREIHKGQDRCDPQQTGDEDKGVLSPVRSYGSGRHRVFRFAEGDDRSRRGAGSFAEEDEDDDGNEGDEEGLEVKKDVLEQHQWSGEPGVTFRGFAERSGERHERRIHRQQQPEYREVRGELSDCEDAGENPEADGAPEKAIVPDSHTVGLLELLEALDLCPRVLAFARGGLECIYFGAGFTDQPIESRARRLDLVLHLDSNAPTPLAEQFQGLHREYLLGLEHPGACHVVAG